MAAMKSALPLKLWILRQLDVDVQRLTAADMLHLDGAPGRGSIHVVLHRMLEDKLVEVDDCLRYDITIQGRALLTQARKELAR